MHRQSILPAMRCIRRSHRHCSQLSSARTSHRYRNRGVLLSCCHGKLSGAAPPASVPESDSLQCRGDQSSRRYRRRDEVSSLTSFLPHCKISTSPSQAGLSPFSSIKEKGLLPCPDTISCTVVIETQETPVVNNKKINYKTPSEDLLTSLLPCSTPIIPYTVIFTKQTALLCKSLYKYRHYLKKKHMETCFSFLFREEIWSHNISNRFYFYFSGLDLPIAMQLPASWEQRLIYLTWEGPNSTNTDNKYVAIHQCLRSITTEDHFAPPDTP